MSPSSPQGAPSERRLTSTGRHSRPGVGPPKRIVTRTRRIIEKEALGKTPDESWQARVRQVQSCSLAEYDNGRGLQTVFEASDDDKEKQRCHVLCTGNIQGLTISLKVSSRSSPPSLLHEFSLPDPANKIGVRLYDASVSMEIREEPKKPMQHRSKRMAPVASGHCWVIHLDVTLKPESVLVQSKTMLRRVESTTSAMPEDWFSYRNFFVDHRPGTQTTSNIVFGDALTHSFVGGYTWRFTGHLASASFRDALGWDAVDQVEKTDDEMGPGQVTTRQSKTARGKKAANKAPAKARRAQRVLTRSMGQVKEPAEKGSDVTSESEEEEDKEYDIDGLLEKTITGGKTLYRVQWSGDYTPTWEPAGNITTEAIAEFEKNVASKKGKQKQAKPPAKKPEKRKRRALK